MMHLALYLEAGIHQGGWRYPDAVIGSGINWPLYRKIARRAEEAKLDMLFVADKLAIDDIFAGDVSETVKSRQVGWSEPMTLLSALAAVTDDIGLGGTISSSYSLPYSAARMLANIDHISAGRAAWNLVTSVSDAEARNFGRPQHFSHQARYERAAEYIALVKQLWDSFEEHAFVGDKKGAQYARPDAFHYLHHQGDAFQVKGPLNVERPPQGHPVLIQAGVSDSFVELAARHAEVLFVVQPDKARALAFYQRIKQQAVLAGRGSDQLKVLPGLVPIVGATHATAREKKAQLDKLITPQAGLSFVSASMNYDLSQFPLDAPMPDIRDLITGSKGRFQYVIQYAIEQGMTVGEMGKWYAESLSFPSPVGSPDEVAAMMIDWYRAGACDGFVVLPCYLEEDRDLFLEEVVPRLQRAGVFRTAYEGKTLRDRLGLSKPANHFHQS